MRLEVAVLAVLLFGSASWAVDPVRPSDVDQWGSTLLMHHASSGNLSGARTYLGRHHQNVNFTNIYTRRTALHFAFADYQVSKKHEYDEVIKLLLKHGADPRIEDEHGESVFGLIQNDARISRNVKQRIVEQGEKLNKHDQVGPPYYSTPLMYAAEACRLSEVESLLAQGNNPNFQNPMNGKTALHFVLKGSAPNKVACANVLLRYGASLFIRDFGLRKGPGVSIDDTLRWDNGFNLEGRTGMEIIQDANARASFEGIDLDLANMVYQTEKPIQDGRVVMNDLFDGIYLLNLTEFQPGIDRYKKFVDRIKPLGSFKFERFPGFYFNPKYGSKPNYVGDGVFNEKGKVYDFKWFIENKRIAYIGELNEGTLMGQIAVLLGHLQIIKKAKAEGKKRILLLEDDIAFAPFFLKSTKAALSELDRNEKDKWKLLYLDTNSRFLLHLMDEQKYKDVKKAYGMLMLSCLVINESMFDPIIKRISEIFDVTKPPQPAIDVALANDLQSVYDSYFVFPLPAYQDDGGFSQIGY